MRYYLRRSLNTDVQGPLSLENINAGLECGNLGAEWLATADLGESLQRVRRQPQHQWTQLSNIPGTIVFDETASARITAGDIAGRGCEVLFWLLIVLILAFACLMATCSMAHF